VVRAGACAVVSKKMVEMLRTDEVKRQLLKVAGGLHAHRRVR
jgi:hypothetical protein